jgi:hypothetical protein
MRVNLKCPYSDKDEAKSLGARWDVARKTWYVIDPEDLTVFSKWLGDLIKQAPEKKAAPKKSGDPFVTTGVMFVDLAHPVGVLPWEDEDPAELIRLVSELGAQ